MDTADLLTEAVNCDLCGGDTQIPGYSPQFGLLQAKWGYGSRHDGERYRVQLCEACFFKVLVYIKQERRIEHLFDNDSSDDQDLGLVAHGDYWGDISS